jgi:hypothetical protein
MLPESINRFWMRAWEGARMNDVERGMLAEVFVRHSQHHGELFDAIKDFIDIRLSNLRYSCGQIAEADGHKDTAKKIYEQQY